MTDQSHVSIASPCKQPAHQFVLFQSAPLPAMSLCIWACADNKTHSNNQSAHAESTVSAAQARLGLLQAQFAHNGAIGNP